MRDRDLNVVVVGPIFLDVVMSGLDHLPSAGQEVYVDSASWSPGGYAISAIALSRLGVRTHLLTELGQDEMGEVILSRLTAEGVNTILPHYLEKTNIAVALNWNGDRGIVSFTHPLKDPIDDLRQVLDRAPGLLLLSARHPFARNIAAEGLARRLPVALSLSWHPEFLTSRSLQQLFSLADHLFCNVPEALLVTGQTDFRKALAILGEALPQVVITRGSEGAVALVQGEYVESPACPAVIVDATGAGDVFAAGYLAAELHGLPVIDRLRAGNWAAGRAVAQVGGSTGAPCWVDVERFLRQVGVNR